MRRTRVSNKSRADGQESDTRQCKAAWMRLLCDEGMCYLPGEILPYQRETGLTEPDTDTPGVKVGSKTQVLMTSTISIARCGYPHAGW